MTWKQTGLWLIVAGIIFSGIGSCTARSAARNSSASGETGVLGIILAEPVRFESVTVTVSCMFQGWRGPCPTAPPISRSDWMITDASGCLYVHGPVPPGLDSAKPSGEKISVTGVVRLKKGLPYLDATAVKK